MSVLREPVARRGPPTGVPFVSSFVFFTWFGVSQAPCRGCDVRHAHSKGSLVGFSHGRERFSYLLRTCGFAEFWWVSAPPLRPRGAMQIALFVPFATPP